MESTAPRNPFPLSLGLNKLGLIGIEGAAVVGAHHSVADRHCRARVCCALRSTTVYLNSSARIPRNSRTYEEIDRRFPSSEYDVLVVVEGKKLLTREGLTAFANAASDLQLADGVDGIVSMLSARGRPDASGYAPPIVPDELPEGRGLRRHARRLSRATTSSRASFCPTTASWR